MTTRIEAGMPATSPSIKDAPARRQNPAALLADEEPLVVKVETSRPQVGQNFESAGEPQFGQYMNSTLAKNC
jgi:hypothetical protein